MTTEQAEGAVVTLMAAYARSELPPETVSMYVKFFEQVNVEDSEPTVDMLIRTRRRFPSLAEIHDALDVVREQHAERRKQAFALPEPAVPEDVRRNLTRGGLQQAREVLKSKGVLPKPANARAGDFDGPPLTTVERRHRHHVAQEIRVSQCRFCQGAESAKEEGA